MPSFTHLIHPDVFTLFLSSHTRASAHARRERNTLYLSPKASEEVHASLARTLEVQVINESMS